MREVVVFPEYKVCINVLLKIFIVHVRIDFVGDICKYIMCVLSKTIFLSTDA